MENTQNPNTFIELDDEKLDQVAGGLTRWRCNGCGYAVSSEGITCPVCQCTEFTPYEGMLSNKFA